MTPRPQFRALAGLLVVYAAATLLHFVHNAEFAGHYPGFPATWSRTVVYLSWLGLTCVGLAGLAPLSAHTFAMNGTILFEVTCAGVVLDEVARQTARRMLPRAST